MSEAEGPSKRAMEIAERMNAAGALVNAPGRAIIDAELRKGAELAKAVEAVLLGDYPRPPKNGQCKHGVWSFGGGCEACIDEHLESALSAYRGSQP